MSLAAPSDSASGGGSASSEPPAPPRQRPGETPRAFVAHNLHERIQAATARAIAARGYEATTVKDICTEASISESVFHEHFKDKQAASMSALETAVDQVMTDLRESFRAAPAWPEAIWDTTDAILEWMTHEPAVARLGFVEMMTAGEAALELLQSLMDAFALFLEPGYELVPEKASTKSLVDETVANAIFGLLHERIAQEGTAELRALLPEIVRRVLTPFLGAEAAGAFVAQRGARG